ncbi:MAG: hypothetical protein GXY83_44605 [Rhodopirellula sp.]|nr:hypothetical protein [Rhodopirellula sp.]
MAIDQTWEDIADALNVEEAIEPVKFRRPTVESADLDITPMIDMTFLLLIFFLVASTPDTQIQVDLPPARYGTGVSEQSSVVITVADRGAGLPAAVYLADGKVGDPLPDDPKLQEAAILQAVEDGYLGGQGKSNVLVKAEKGVRHREVSRVASAASQVEGIKLHLAVMEMD